MKILVCISKSPDTTSKIAFTDGNTKFDENGVQYIVNPYDEWYALVRALELKEANGGTVTTITVGTAADDSVIRKALAIGADDAVRIDAEPTDAYFTAMQIAEHAKAGGYDLVLAGKETINYNGSQVGGMIAEAMDLPFISLASKMDVNGSINAYALAEKLKLTGDGNEDELKRKEIEMTLEREINQIYGSFLNHSFGMDLCRLITQFWSFYDVEGISKIGGHQFRIFATSIHDIRSVGIAFNWLFNQLQV